MCRKTEIDREAAVKGLDIAKKVEILKAAFEYRKYQGGS